MQTLAELLDPYKGPMDEEDGGLETPESVYSIMNDEVAKAILSVWQAYPITWTPTTDSAPEDLNARWEWLWAGCGIDTTLLAKKVGMPKFLVAQRFEILKTARLIYPDGAISRYASAIMRADVSRRLRGEGGGRRT